MCAIKECGNDRKHIKIANIILGPAKATIEGKTNKIPRDSGLITHIPSNILERYGMVTLGLDVMHINKRSFVLLVSKHIKYFQCMGTRIKTVKTFMSIIGKMKANISCEGLR